MYIRKHPFFDIADLRLGTKHPPLLAPLALSASEPGPFVQPLFRQFFFLEKSLFPCEYKTIQAKEEIQKFDRNSNTQNCK